MKYIDVHSHVQFAAFDEDRADVLLRAKESDTWMINVGTQADTSRAAVNLAEEAGEGVFATVGLHPVHTSKSYHDEKELGEGGKAFTSRGEDFDSAFYEALGAHPKVVAIGECGLDYYRLEDDTKVRQKETFRAQIELANELGKPLMLHIRNAYRDAYEILKSEAKVRGDVHFFAGSWEEAKLFLDLGFSLSFTGVLTFTRDYDEVVEKTALDMILSETDCPYITPVPHRGKRNEPALVSLIVEKIAEIKKKDPEEVRKALVANAGRVFALGGKA